MRKLVVAFVAAVALSACGGNQNCKEACDRLAACGFSSSGFSCDAKCEDPNATCAECINMEDHACSDLANTCATDCPGKSFAAK